MSTEGLVYESVVDFAADNADHVTWTIPAMNRMLVERATHPEMLRELSETLGGRWLSHEAKVFGLRAAEAGIARTHALSREEPFDEDLAFPDLDEKVRTRLGEDGHPATVASNAHVSLPTSDRERRSTVSKGLRLPIGYR